MAARGRVLAACAGAVAALVGVVAVEATYDAGSRSRAATSPATTAPVDQTAPSAALAPRASRSVSTPVPTLTDPLARDRAERDDPADQTERDRAAIAARHAARSPSASASQTAVSLTDDFASVLGDAGLSLADADCRDGGCVLTVRAAHGAYQDGLGALGKWLLRTANGCSYMYEGGSPTARPDDVVDMTIAFECDGDAMPRPAG